MGLRAKITVVNYRNMRYNVRVKMAKYREESSCGKKN
jgi:hypothetical protein